MVALSLSSPHAGPRDNGFGLGRPGETWALALGGRLYDMWWPSLGVTPPEGNHPAYPKAGRQEGWTTWRCVTCHGWDYRGVTFRDGTTGRTVKIRGINDMAGKPPAGIAAIIRARPHNYTAEMISDSALEKLALFVSRGQHDVTEIFAADGRAKGSPARAAGLFHDVCANCHGRDGTAFLEAEQGDVPTLGWLSVNKPAQALHKVLNGQPGADMLALRFLGHRTIADLMAYLQTLPKTPSQ